MNIAKLNENNIVLDVIVATLQEAQTTYPNDTWAECPEWVGIGMDINTPKPEPILEPILEQGAA
jgi:hypothetical protein